MSAEVPLDPEVITSSIRTEPKKLLVPDSWVVQQLYQRANENKEIVAPFELKKVWNPIYADGSLRLRFTFHSSVEVGTLLQDMIHCFKRMGVPDDSLVVSGTLDTEDLKYSALHVFEPEEYERMRDSGNISADPRLFPLETLRSEIPTFVTAWKIAEGRSIQVLEDGPIHPNISTDYYLKAYALYAIDRQNRALNKF